MNPAEKKAKDLANHRKNTYGQSDKASRKAIPRFKRASARKERRAEKSSLGDGEESGPILRFPAFRRKWPDSSMADVLARRLSRRIRQMVPAGGSEEWVDAFQRGCVEDGISAACADAWARYLRGELTCGVIPLPRMELGELRRLADRLGSWGVAGGGAFVKP